jgi:spore coat polysaccharide biosynthesis protein SpsF
MKDKQNKKTGIIIQARMSSTRLPGKVMLKLVNKEVLWHVVKRCQKSKLVDTGIVATSTDPIDDKIEKFCKKYRFNIYRGSLNNVLERYYLCAKQYNLDTIIRITSDCPLIDPTIINLAIEKFEQEQYDYLSNIVGANQTNFPIGLSVEVFSFSALEKNYKEAKSDYEKEHVTPSFYENTDKFKVAPILKPLPGYNKSYRITLDYPEDFKLIKAVYNNLYKNNEIIDTKRAIAFLTKNPKISAINSNVAQKSYK